MLLDPAEDLLFWEADIRLDSNVWNEPALDVRINGFHVDLQQCLQFFRCKHLRKIPGTWLALYGGSFVLHS